MDFDVCGISSASVLALSVGLLVVICAFFYMAWRVRDLQKELESERAKVQTMFAVVGEMLKIQERASNRAADLGSIQTLMNFVERAAGGHSAVNIYGGDNDIGGDLMGGGKQMRDGYNAGGDLSRQK